MNTFKLVIASLMLVGTAHAVYDETLHHKAQVANQCYYNECKGLTDAKDACAREILSEEDYQVMAIKATVLFMRCLYREQNLRECYGTPLAVDYPGVAGKCSVEYFRAETCLNPCVRDA